MLIAFSEIEKATDDPVALYRLFKVTTFSLWLSKVLETSVAACRDIYTYLLLPEFCCS